jgi:3'(2'), 5'-bisphosphate nucleotidase
MLDIFEAVALAAGKVIMMVYNGDIAVTLKGDQSPVTEADQRAEALILAELSKHFPDIPVVAEEEAAAGRIPEITGQRFILVDPLDGTKEFINRRPDFTVNIALIESGLPVAGVVYAPARKIAYLGSRDRAEKLTIGEDGTVISREKISCRARNEKLTAVASRSHMSPETSAFMDDHSITDYRSVGSSLKFCILAEGDADVYPRFGRTMEWDTAAGDAVLRAAGGATVKTDGMPLQYGKRNQADDTDFANPNFICWGRS